MYRELRYNAKKDGYYGSQITHGHGGDAYSPDCAERTHVWIQHHAGGVGAIQGVFPAEGGQPLSGAASAGAGASPGIVLGTSRVGAAAKVLSDYPGWKKVPGSETG